MLKSSQVSFGKRALAVLTASMFLLTGFSLTASPASAAETETVPYTYTVKVPVTKTVYEYKLVKKSIGNGRFAYTYEKVAKTLTEYRNETRTGYREVPAKVADKPAAAEFKVQVARDAAFTTTVKEIKVTPASVGTNKVNLSNQLAGSVGDVAYVRVIAQNAAGKSTAGKASKLTYGKTGEYNYNVQVPFTDTRVATPGYWDSYFTGSYGTKSAWSPDVYGWKTYSYSYQEAYTASRQVREAYTAYRTVYYTYYVTVKKTGSYQDSYDCGYYKTYYYPTYSVWISKTCYKTVYYTYYEDEPRTGSYQEAYTAYRYVTDYYTAYRTVWDSYDSYEVVSAGYWYTTTDYSNPIYQPYYVPATYENFTNYRTETRTADVNGWKAAN